MKKYIVYSAFALFWSYVQGDEALKQQYKSSFTNTFLVLSVVRGGYCSKLSDEQKERCEDLCQFIIDKFDDSKKVSETCKTPLNEISNCVSLYDCPDLVNALQQRPVPDNVVNFLRQSQCGFEGNTPKVCCGPLPSAGHKPTTYSSGASQPPSRSDQVDPVDDEDSYPAPAGSCGIDENGNRIFGGNETDLDEFMWMALLGYRTTSGSITYQCGGVLINHRYVLTAAHCLTGAIETEIGSIATVRLGEYDTGSDVDCVKNVCAEPLQESPVLGAYPHPGYNDKSRNRKDDIGLVRLAKRATYSAYVKAICLSTNDQRLVAGDDLFVAGWGKTLKGRSSPIKLKLQLPLFSKDECATKYKGLGAVLTDKQICAGGVFSQDTCRGDSGGPLMAMRPDGVWETIAVVSFGYGCGRDGWPGVYSSVAAYSDWIQSTLRSTNV